MIEIALITAPRKSRTIKRSVASLRRAGFTKEITVFSEPDQGSQPIPGTYWIFNDEKYGCFKNYTQALWHLVNNSESPFIGVFSDDFNWSKFSYRDVSKILFDLDGMFAAYTPLGMKPMMSDKGINIINEGWGVTWGGNYIFYKEDARAILEHPMYEDHYQNYEANQQIDHLIPKVCKDLGINQNFNNPSFCDHIGFESTIGHQHSLREKGLNFRG